MLFAITIIIGGLLITSTAVSITYQKVLEDASIVPKFERALICDITAIERANAYKMSSSVVRLTRSLAGTDIPVVDFVETDEKSPSIASYFTDILVVLTQYILENLDRLESNILKMRGNLGFLRRKSISLILAMS